MVASAERLMEIEQFSNDSEKSALDIQTVKAYYSDKLKSFGIKNANFT